MTKENIVPITIWSLRIYNGFMALLYLCVTVLMTLVLLTGTKTTNRTAELITLIVFMAILIPLNLLHIVGLVFASKQKQWVWVLQIAVVCLGFGAILTMIPCVVLLILLISKEVKEYYFNATGKLVVYLPGFSTKNLDEGEHIKSKLETDGYKVYFHKWSHWEKGNESSPWNPENEINRALDSIAKFNPKEIIFIGKSMGSFVAVNLVKQRINSAKLLVMLGIPVNDLSSEEKATYGTILSKVTIPVYLIQNKNDPHGNSEQAKE